mgnify:CR=1 FL=1
MAVEVHNRYRVLQKLGEGGMGAAYLVEDSLRDNQLMTLKKVHPGLLSERDLAQFGHEFAVLSRLRHPNVVRVYDFDAQELCFTMEYVAGEDLAALALRRFSEAPASYDWLYDVIAQLCRALQYIHSRGLIHYDLKPSNIRITPEGQVRLMDFGLIGEPRGEGQVRLRGTPEYVAPELVRGDPVDRRADLYSLGITLYEVTTGRLPFAAETTAEVLRQQVEATPDPPRRFAPYLPAPLEALILKLMAKDPARRFASAAEVLQTLNQQAGLAFPLETRETMPGYIASGNFVGREVELARLQGLLMRAIHGHGQLVLVTGAAGVGKSRLVSELKLRAQVQRVFVCEGSCHEQVRRPFGPWLSILEQLIVHQRPRSPETLRVYGPSLCRLMPELAEQLGPFAGGGELPADRGSLLDAVARFLLACDQPLLLVLEDLHHADAGTIELLDFLARRAAQARWLLCGLYREYGIDETHPLTALARQARLLDRTQQLRTPPADQPYDLLHLDTLSESETAALVQSMLGVSELPAGLLPRLMAQTDGTPLFVEDVMQSLVEEGLLHYDGQSWRVDVEGLQRTPVSIMEAAQRRVSRLDRESLELLQWAAVMGHSLDLRVLAAVCDVEVDDLTRHLNQAVRHHVLTAGERAGETVYHFGTDQVRQAICQTLSPAEQRKRHRRIGQAMQRLYDEAQVAESLSCHFEQAEDWAQALRYARLAADRARQANAVERAAQLYERALSFLRQHPPLADLESEYDIVADLEDCHRVLGQRQAQQADLERMAQIAEALDDMPRRIQVATRRVALANQLGDHAEARQAAEAAVALARQIGDQRLEVESLTALGEACINLGEFEASRACHELALRLSQQQDHRAGVAVSLRRLGDVARRLGHHAEAHDAYEQSLAIYRAIGDRHGECDALNALGIISTDYARARSYHEQSLALAQALGNLANQARSSNNLAIIYWSLGLYSRAREEAELAVSLARRMQERSSLAAYLETMGRIYCDLGEYVQAHRALEEGRAVSIDIGDRWSESLYWMMLGRVALARGRPQEARELIRMACEMQRQLGTVGYLAASQGWLGAAYLALGDWEAADRCTLEAVANLESAGNAGDYRAQDVWWVRYQVLKAAPARAGEALLDDQAWEVLQQAREAMMAGIATLSDEGLRRNYLNRVEVNRNIITEWARQSASRRAAGHDSSPEILTVAEAPAPLALELERVEDRLKRVLAISVRMNETREVDQLLEYVMDQVIELSGAERGFLVLLDESGRMEFRVARGIDRQEIESARSDISYTVIGAVAQSREAVLLQDALADERFGRQSSVLELNLRSVLCVPLISRDELIGMIYADNRSVSGRFAQTDLDLMTIFANQAAIAIENARLYEESVRANRELEAWARTLEQRVAERTAELQRANEGLSRRALQLETSSQVGQQVTSILDLDELLTQVVHLIQERFGYYFVGVWLVEREHRQVVLRAGTTELEQSAIPLDAASVIVSVCRSGQYRLLDDVRQAVDYLHIDALPAARSELALPLRVGASAMGALDILSDVPHAFSLDDRMVLQNLADQIAIAIRNAQLYRLEQRRRLFAESLEQTGRVLSSSLDLRQVPGRILDQLAAVVPYERGSVMLRMENALKIVAERGFPKERSEEDLYVPIRETEEDVFQRMLRSRAPILVDDVSLDPGWQQLEWLPLNRSWIGVPLISKDRVIGMLSLTRREAAAFTPADVQLVTTFAGQAAIALENASLYDEISRLNAHLEEMVRQRTAELERAYRTLEQLDKTKTDFIDVAAHELRTPLTVVKGYAQMLAAHPALKESEDAQLLMQRILDGEARLHEIVNSMLDAARVDIQVLKRHREPVVLADIIERTCLEYRPALRDRHLTLTMSNLEELPPVEADPSLLYKVFYHLVGNAIKYTPDGGAISIEGRSVMEGDRPAVEIVVADTGIGIDKEHHELIFEKFYQTGEVSLHSSGRTKFKGGGPGLGLAISKGIVLAHDGRIWVESEGYDEVRCPGSRFYVCLPLHARSTERGNEREEKTD